MTQDERPGLWRFKVGQKGLNRVTVYEREAGSPLQIEWFDAAGRHRETLTNTAGHPVLDKELAEEIARRSSEAQRRRREAKTAEALLGQKRRRTVGELLAAYHEAREPDWKAEHRRTQRLLRGFWTQALGKATPLRDVTPDRVERVVQTGARAKAWSARTRQKHLKYIVAAMNYARKKKKWISEAEDLSAVELPKSDARGPAYSREEMAALRDAAPDVGVLVAAAIEVAYATGRRLTAIRTLPVSAYRVETVAGREVGVVTFPKETDKAGRAGEAPLTAAARRAVERLLERPAVRASGLLFPSGDTGRREPLRRKRWHSISGKDLTDLLHAVERKAEVEEVPGRAWHGIKRRTVTDQRRAYGGDMGVVSRQSGTTEEVLRRIYEQDDLAPKVALVERLEAYSRSA